MKTRSKRTGNDWNCRKILSAFITTFVMSGFSASAASAQEETIEFTDLESDAAVSAIEDYAQVRADVLVNSQALPIQTWRTSTGEASKTELSFRSFSSSNNLSSAFAAQMTPTMNSLLSMREISQEHGDVYVSSEVDVEVESIERVSSNQIRVLYDETVLFELDTSDIVEWEGGAVRETPLMTGGRDQYAATFVAEPSGRYALDSVSPASITEGATGNQLSWPLPPEELATLEVAASDQLNDDKLTATGEDSTDRIFTDSLAELDAKNRFESPLPLNRGTEQTQSLGGPGPDFNTLQSGISFEKRNVMASYALKWALGRNPDFTDFQTMGGDCTNFTSQALYQGGWYRDETVSPSGATNDEWTFYPQPDGRRWGNSNWRGVDEFYAYARGDGGTWSRGNIYSYLIGEIIQMDFTRNGSKDHGMIITERYRRADNSLETRVSYHTTDTYNKALWRIVADYDAAYYGHALT